MVKKKSDQTEISPEQQTLERRVDAMMSVEPPPKTPSPTEIAIPAAPPPVKPTAPQPPTATTADEPQSTAPLLPTKLLKAIGADKKVKTKTPQEHPADIALTIGEPADKPAKSKPKAVPATAPAKVETSPMVSDDNIIEDSETDKAVDDIVAHEADTQLAVDDARARRRSAEAENRNRPNLLVAFFTSPWTWLIIIGTLTVLYLWYR